jgi:hypothetical protein
MAQGRFEQLGMRMARRATAQSHDRKLLQKQALDRVIRYEAHISWQLKEALKMLREFQAERRAKEEAARRIETAAVRSVIGEVETATVPEAIAERSQLPPRSDTGGSSFGNRTEAAASGEAPGRPERAESAPAVGSAEFVRSILPGRTNGTHLPTGSGKSS